MLSRGHAHDPRITQLGACKNPLLLAKEFGRCQNSGDARESLTTLDNINQTDVLFASVPLQIGVLVARPPFNVGRSACFFDSVFVLIHI